MDANEHIYKGKLGEMLTDREGLSMIEAVSESTGKHLGATFFRGRRPIDGVWHTRGIHVANACVMPVGYGVGDHRLFILDILTTSLIGTPPPRIVRPAIR